MCSEQRDKDGFPLQTSKKKMLFLVYSWTPINMKAPCQTVCLWTRCFHEESRTVQHCSSSLSKHAWNGHDEGWCWPELEKMSVNIVAVWWNLKWKKLGLQQIVFSTRGCFIVLSRRNVCTFIFQTSVITRLKILGSPNKTKSKLHPLVKAEAQLLFTSRKVTKRSENFVSSWCVAPL